MAGECDCQSCLEMDEEMRMRLVNFMSTSLKATSYVIKVVLIRETQCVSEVKCRFNKSPFLSSLSEIKL